MNTAIEYSRKALHRLFVADCLGKFTALMVAILLWIYVGDEILSTIHLTIPIRLEVGTGVIARVRPPQLRVSLKGPKKIINGLNKHRFVGRLDVNTTMLLGKCHNIVWVDSATLIRLPSEVHIVDAPSPRKVGILIYQSKERLLKITPDIRWALPPDQRDANITVTPGFIKVKGAATLLTKATTIGTEPLYIENIRCEKKMTFSVKILEHIDGEPVMLTQKRVMVSIEMAEHFPKK